MDVSLCQQRHPKSTVPDPGKDALVLQFIKIPMPLALPFHPSLTAENCRAHRKEERRRNKPVPVISVDFSFSRLLYGLKNFFFLLLVKQCSLELSQ
jgi:hypothetical protein